MGQVIGDILPLALGIAISPLPIIATILMLLAPNARASSVGFMTGWLAGIVVAVVAFTLLSSVIPAGGEGGGGTVAAIVKMIVGALLVLLAVKQWRGRPKDGSEPELPKWMSALDSMSPVRAGLLAFALAAVNPKNLLLAVSAGLIIGAGATPATQIAGVAVFVVIAASTVVAPVVAFLVASKQLAAPLESLRVWLVHNNSTIMAVLLLVMGFSVIGKGLAAL
ncbi:GAP family protein [Leucobacter aridicollis]|uniref:GAP family protein n=1 Tax=Leucobacter aridicollis TaxID=283878 RepID=UPI000E64F3FC|nr:GAP family protein [Leucobacter aridicollis]UTX52006.1 GAP family protein [Leucobacter aridicollis]